MEDGRADGRDGTLQGRRASREELRFWFRRGGTDIVTPAPETGRARGAVRVDGLAEERDPARGVARGGCRDGVRGERFGEPLVRDGVRATLRGLVQTHRASRIDLWIVRLTFSLDFLIQKRFSERAELERKVRVSQVERKSRRVALTTRLPRNLQRPQVVIDAMTNDEMFHSSI